MCSFLTPGSSKSISYALSSWQKHATGIMTGRFSSDKHVHLTSDLFPPFVQLYVIVLSQQHLPCFTHLSEPLKIKGKKFTQDMAKILETNRDTLARLFSDDLDYFCKFILRGFLRKIRLSFLSERNQRMMKPSKT